MPPPPSRRNMREADMEVAIRSPDGAHVITSSKTANTAVTDTQRSVVTTGGTTRSMLDNVQHHSSSSLSQMVQHHGSSSDSLISESSNGVTKTTTRVTRTRQLVQTTQKSSRTVTTSQTSSGSREDLLSSLQIDGDRRPSHDWTKLRLESNRSGSLGDIDFMASRNRALMEGRSSVSPMRDTPGDMRRMIMTSRSRTNSPSRSADESGSHQDLDLVIRPTMHISKFDDQPQYMNDDPTSALFNCTSINLIDEMGRSGPLSGIGHGQLSDMGDTVMHGVVQRSVQRHQSEHHTVNGNTVHSSSSTQVGHARAEMTVVTKRGNPFAAVRSFKTPNFDNLVENRDEDLYLTLCNEGEGDQEEYPLYQIYETGQEIRALQDVYSGEDDEGAIYDSIEWKDDPDEIPSIEEIQSKVDSLGHKDQTDDEYKERLQELISSTHGCSTLWGNMEEVRNSGILSSIEPLERKRQEMIFEIIASEASYLRTLQVLISHFVDNPILCGKDGILDKPTQKLLFANIKEIRDASRQFMMQMEKLWREPFMMTYDVLDILSDFTHGEFLKYCAYIANLNTQQRKIAELKEKNPDFKKFLTNISKSAALKNLPMDSFLASPNQRVVKYPLLVKNIVKIVPEDHSDHRRVKQTLDNCLELAKKCDDEANYADNMFRLSQIVHKLDYKNMKMVPLMSERRWIVREGELLCLPQQHSGPFAKKGKREMIEIFLFNDYILLARKMKDGKSRVIDYAPRIQVYAEEKNSDSQMTKHIPSGTGVFLLNLVLLKNHNQKQKEYIFNCPAENERQRWIEAVTPSQQVNEGEKVYEEWGRPKFQAIRHYKANQNDELTLTIGDVIEVHKKLSDGWFYGTRIRDHKQGWFPEAYTKEISSDRARRLNYIDRYKVNAKADEMMKAKTSKS